MLMNVRLTGKLDMLLEKSTRDANEEEAREKKRERTYIQALWPCVHCSTPNHVLEPVVKGPLV
jgi:hypothetical protein